MNERVKRLSEEIRKLPPEDQADLLDELIVLTHTAPDPEIEKSWRDEIRDRIAAHERGDLKARPADEVLKKYLKP
jgi:hypothetical protein